MYPNLTLFLVGLGGAALVAALVMAAILERPLVSTLGWLGVATDHPGRTSCSITPRSR